MNNRPKSITFISWFIIVTGVLGLITSLTSMNNPLVLELMAKSPIPVSIQFVILYVGLLIAIASGIFMLRGANWSRFLYIIYRAFNFLIVLVTSPTILLIPQFIVYGIIVFFLFKPDANKFFDK